MQALKDIAVSIGIGALMLSGATLIVALVIGFLALFWDYLAVIIAIGWLVFMCWTFGSMWQTRRELRRSHG